jgi:sialate O-acetylesterase
MIAPVIPYGIRGVLWYQGEAINGGATGYKLYPLLQSPLIRDWHERWGEGNFPLYICQITPLKSWPNRPDTWYNNPDVREAQATVLSVPDTGMAVTIDIGDSINIDPKDKQDVAPQVRSGDRSHRPRHLSDLEPGDRGAGCCPLRVG